MSRKKAFFVLAVVAGLAAAGLSAAAARQPGTAPGPETAVEHRNTQDPAEVDRHWTPDRIRQADENMRHQSGPAD
jgi:ABC-type oligopeptide transport system substrate-binding subunit